MNAYNFWNTLDDSRNGKQSLKEICRQVGIKYQTIADQRTDCRFPKLEDAYALAKALDVSIEFLLTGQTNDLSCPEARAVNADKELQALVRAVQRDRRLLQVIAAVVKSDEERTRIG